MPANANPMDIAIATLLDKDLKSCVSTNARSACESTTPQLRQAFTQISQEGIQRQARLAGMMAQKGWYVPPQADQSTINTLMPQLQAATQGLGANAGVDTPVR
ncbi:MAG: spore coat protein [Bacillota bacterium]